MLSQHDNDVIMCLQHESPLSLVSVCSSRTVQTEPGSGTVVSRCHGNQASLLHCGTLLGVIACNRKWRTQIDQQVYPARL